MKIMRGFLLNALETKYRKPWLPSFSNPSLFVVSVSMATTLIVVTASRAATLIEIVNLKSDFPSFQCNIMTDLTHCRDRSLLALPHHCKITSRETLLQYLTPSATSITTIYFSLTENKNFSGHFKIHSLTRGKKTTMHKLCCNHLEQLSSRQTGNGMPYSNQHCWLIRIWDTRR